MKRLLVGVGVLVALAALGGEAGGTRTATGSWIGTYSLGGPGQFSLAVSGKRAFVALGVGHADLQSVPLVASGAKLRFQLPGRPSPLVFDGAVSGGRMKGTVRQGALRGTFSARAGNAPALLARGFYATSGGQTAVVDDPYGPARIVNLDSGRVRALYQAGTGFLIGSGFATRSPSTGTIRFGTGSAFLDGKPAARVGVRQLEVQFRSGSAWLSGTLLIPPGAGKHAGAVFVHGSGPTQRAYLPELTSMLVRHGVAVLVYDKRGIGQSGGSYPGESATAGTIDTLARDAQAAARFLAAQPEIDPERIGLTGHSQGGWIVPLAASREAAIRFLLVFSGPAVTVDENDLWQDLAGEGERAATLTDAQIDAQVLKAGPGGVDPIPWVRKLKIPSLWVYGGRDRHVPPGLSERRLAPLAAEPGRDITVVDFPNANHALVETTTGLTSEMLRSDTYAPGLFDRVGEWLKAKGLGR